MFVTHGWPKLIGGPEKWAAIGKAVSHLGIDFAPAFWGLLAALSEFGGGLLIAAGILFRPACAALVATMTVASVMHLSQGDGFGKASHAIEAGILFLALSLIGPGRLRARFPRG